MLTAMRARWYETLHGLWFVPGLVTSGFALLGIVLVQLDRRAGADGIDVFFGGSASAARTILSTVAGSVITVAGLAFSITIITLQLVSQQFSPRATRTFLGNRPTQLAAGAFLGIFVYCLVVLRAVRQEDAGEFVPGLSVAVAIAFGVLGIGVLLFFINHTAQSIKVTSIASRIARETLSAIDRLYPEVYGKSLEEADDDEDLIRRWDGEEAGLSVRPERPGFVQRVDLDGLVARLPEGVERLHVAVAPGEFVTEEQALATAWPGDERAREQIERAVRAAVVVASEREVREDAGYGIQQLSDIALKAISPSVNDPTTAVTCVGYIAACLERLAGRAFPSTRRRFPDDAVEVLVRRADFGLFVAQGLDDVARWSASSPRVVKALLSAAARATAAAAAGGAEERVEVLRHTAGAAVGPALEEARTEDDRAGLEAAFDEVVSAAEPGSAALRIAAGGHRPW